MNKNTETIFIDSDNKIFAKRLTQITTTWTLRDLMAAAGIPVAAQIEPHWHYDEYGDEHRLSADDVVLKRVQYFDEQGRELMPVSIRKERPRTEVYYETEFREMTDAELQTANRCRKAEPTSEEVETTSQE